MLCRGLSEFGQCFAAVGQADAAYQLLLAQALPWVEMRYDGYKDFRIDLYREILHGAIARQDADAMEKLLTVM